MPTGRRYHSTLHRCPRCGVEHGGTPGHPWRQPHAAQLCDCCQRGTCHIGSQPCLHARTGHRSGYATADQLTLRGAALDRHAPFTRSGRYY